MNNSWLYHKDKGAKLFDLDVNSEIELFNDGWCDSPAKFDDSKKENPVDDSNIDKVKTTTNDKDKIESIFDRFSEDSSQIEKPELIELSKYLGVRANNTMKEATIVKKIQEKLNDNG